MVDWLDYESSSGTYRPPGTAPPKEKDWLDDLIDKAIGAIDAPPPTLPGGYDATPPYAERFEDFMSRLGTESPYLAGLEGAISGPSVSRGRLDPLIDRLLNWEQGPEWQMMRARGREALSQEARNRREILAHQFQRRGLARSGLEAQDMRELEESRIQAEGTMERDLTIKMYEDFINRASLAGNLELALGQLDQRRSELTIQVRTLQEQAARARMQGAADLAVTLDRETRARHQELLAIEEAQRNQQLQSLGALNDFLSNLRGGAGMGVYGFGQQAAGATQRAGQYGTSLGYLLSLLFGKGS